jgi:uncharacterized membrane protein
MEPKKIKTFTIILSLTTFIISLTQNAVTIDYLGIKSVPALDYFLMGSTAFLGGGLLEEIIWFANPLSLLAIALLAKNERSAISTSVIALILSLAFSTWKEILGAESGTMAKIISLDLGYYLWLLSIALLTIGTLMYFKIENKDTNA